MDLKDARKRKGISQDDLARIVGMDQPTLSQLETGRRPLTLAGAIKMAAALDVPPKDLLVHNQGAVMEKAMDRGDASGVLHAAKSIVTASEGEGMTKEGEEYLDKLVQGAITFAEKSRDTGLFMGEDDVSSDGRDGLGRRVKSLKSAGAEPEAYTHDTRSPLEEADEDYDSYEYDGLTADGRDGNGIRVAAFHDSDDDNSEVEIEGLSSDDDNTGLDDDESPDPRPRDHNGIAL